ncbi:MAG: hypothetical protein FWF96_03630 [Kiritimatiellaeota bacterium]|nr:hypothetical protein [Kiritimatiellota bacterium]
MSKCLTRAVVLACATTALSHLNANAQESEAALLCFNPGNPSLFVTNPKGEGKALNIGPMFWGPNWGWTGVNGKFEAQDGGAAARISGNIGNTAGVTFSGAINLMPDGKRKIRMSGDLSVSADTDILQFCLGIDPVEDWRGAGRLTVVNADGAEAVHVSPPNGGNPVQLANTKVIRARNSAGREMVITFDEAVDIDCHGQIRWPIAKAHVNADEPRKWGFTIEFPFDVDIHPTMDTLPLPADIDRYFAWNAAADTGPSVIGAQGLLDAPAGKHGRVKAVGDKLVYNGAPFKIWGLNTCYSSIAPSKEVAEQRAAFYAKNGVNAVRLHKFADGPDWNGVLSRDSSVLYSEEPNKAPAMDYYVACLKEKGIYVKLSTNFGNTPLGPAERARVPYVTGDGWKTPNHAAVWLDKEVQDIQIAQLVNMLKRTNSATGIRYADDPCVILVELINENCAFFYAVWGGAMNTPALKQMAGEQFRDWLHKKYGTEEKLLEVWKVYNNIPDQGTAGESWDGVIYPGGNPWFWDNVSKQDGRWNRLVDAALFWYETQNAFYDRFVKAIRETGYEGEILASNWQAGSGVAHFLNLISDAKVGLIDRHNYHGAYWSMFHKPGSGIISAGLNTQIEDRPYMISEWIHEAKAFYADPLIPKPFDIASEGPVLFAAYGMGLNGWDGSFIFENADNGVFKNVIADTWDVVLPNIIGLFPAISRQVHRGDIKESELVFARNLDMASLEKGNLGFNDKLESGGYDVRAFTSEILPESLLAVGRNVVRLNDEPTATEAVDPAQFIKDGRLVSATGELSWRAGDNNRDGDIHINTPSTQALAGFSQGNKAVLKDVDIQTDSPYAVIYVTSLDDAKPIAQAKSVLITALARIRNTNQRIVGGSSVNWGGAPILMEPVTAEINVKRAGDFTVHVLDQDGRRTGANLVANGRAIKFDTAVDKTIYYEIEFK